MCPLSEARSAVRRTLKRAERRAKSVSKKSASGSALAVRTLRPSASPSNRPSRRSAVAPLSSGAASVAPASSVSSVVSSTRDDANTPSTDVPVRLRNDADWYVPRRLRRSVTSPDTGRAASPLGVTRRSSAASPCLRGNRFCQLAPMRPATEYAPAGRIINASTPTAGPASVRRSASCPDSVTAPGR